MTEATLLIGAGLEVQRFSPLSSRWEHGSIIERGDPQTANGDCLLWAARWRLSISHTGQGLSIGGLKAYLHRDTLPLTRPHLLLVPLPMSWHSNT